MAVFEHDAKPVGLRSGHNFLLVIFEDVSGTFSRWIWIVVRNHQRVGRPRMKVVFCEYLIPFHNQLTLFSVRALPGGCISTGFSARIRNSCKNSYTPASFQAFTIPRTCGFAVSFIWSERFRL